MSLSSIPFIFIFLPIFTLLYFLIPHKGYRSIVLIIGSIFFFFWIDPSHLPVIGFSILINYIAGILIHRAQIKHGRGILSRSLTISAITVNLALLVLYKYLDFLLLDIVSPETLNLHPNLASLPLGISYFTFSGIAYITDVWRNIEPGETNFIKFANFMIMFPKLMMGPITRYQQVKENLPAALFYNPHFLQGFTRLIRGLGKKVILADNFALISKEVLETGFTNITPGVAWFGLLAFTFQIFFDFSGYTDMALGLGSMLGYTLPENFNYPYIARSVSDFWRRWHMSLTAWFRTYLFIPLEFKRKKAGLMRQPVNLFIVFLLTGLWHGAGWNFIIWGGYYGIILAVETMLLAKQLKRLPGILQHIYSLVIILVGWIFFWLTDISQWGALINSLFGANNSSMDITLRSLNILLYTPLFIIGALLSTPIPARLQSFLETKGFIGRLIVILFYLCILLVAVSYILANGYQSFLYAQF